MACISQDCDGDSNLSARSKSGIADIADIADMADMAYVACMVVWLYGCIASVVLILVLAVGGVSMEIWKYGALEEWVI